MGMVQVQVLAMDWEWELGLVQDLAVEGAMVVDWARAMAPVQGVEEEMAKEEAKEEEKVPVPAQDSEADWAMVPAPVPVVEVD